MSALRNSSNPQSNTPTPKRAQSFQSLNHLTNFSLPPRTQPIHNAPRRSRRPITQQAWNKEKFVNAQYRFIMKPTGDYTVHFADPDIFFQWEDILQVIIPPSHINSYYDIAGGNDQAQSTYEHTNCPICLSFPPTAPRVTKCGHIFCYPCILRYLHQGDNPKWNRCPICFDSVTEKHLKCVTWQDTTQGMDLAQLRINNAIDDSLDGLDLSHTPFSEGPVNHNSDVGLHLQNPGNTTTLTMRLIERPQITTLALPRSASWPSDLIPPHQAPFHFLPEVSTFAKFMLATPSYIVANLTQELDQLEQERRILGSEAFRDEIGVVFVQAAETKVKHQIEKALSLDTPILKAAIEKAERGVRALEKADAERSLNVASKRMGESGPEIDPSNPIPEALLAATPRGFASGSSPPKPTQLPPRAHKQRRNLNPPPHSTSTYYFYQATSGAPVFLHPLDIRILHAHFKSYTAFPDTITFNVTSSAFTSSTINDDLRKRCKYLAHLPEAADVVFVEAGWELEAVVGSEDLKPFEAALKMRLGKRKEKDRREERAKVKAEEREREIIFQSARFSVSSFTPVRSVSPVVSDADVESTTTQPQPSAPTNAPTRPAATGAWGTRSFATAIAASSPMRPVTHAAQRTRDRDEDAEWEHEIDAAWQELETSVRGTGGGRKKKAGKKLVLLTGGRRM